MAIVVIGHGRSPEGRGWGEKIDACTVIRCWDWEWQSLADYGERYDYGVLALIPFSIRPFLETTKSMPAVGWLGYARARDPIDMSRLPKMQIIDQRYRDLAVKELGAKPSFNLTRGCAAACWAIDAADDSVVLVGFDNLKVRKALELEDAFPDPVKENWDQWHPGWRGKLYNTHRQGSHDIAVERPLLEHLARDRGVKLNFAEEIWS